MAEAANHPRGQADAVVAPRSVAFIDDTTFDTCAVCSGSIRRRGRHGRWVHIIDGQSFSTTIRDHYAHPAE